MLSVVLSISLSKQLTENIMKIIKKIAKKYYYFNNVSKPYFVSIITSKYPSSKCETHGFKNMAVKD